ncbi:MAG: HNH endonuclease [Mesorhizobium sp.]|uniref:HNH endonuclease n=1 Tax=Mesorhizobium sp. TaxID=1871066 RepID=UPI000FE6ECBB|nr:HNH endonuclease [Mesorhizobium sp.]RWN28348.1 MAG: HNH endonuclease [Mesorhizobium sp.]RWN65006.1 MAG: HNH endonuclease [Mesorhizobium sp.]RWP72153.1 MAG: HNH endonuclease [Mesorhizobium sp.]RWQ42594.1 MAG: HNH endonuclease [Mesorhizobium sp.]
MKAVFDVKPASGYKDDITRRYHFPSRSNYLDAARNAAGDWVLFREPQRNGGRRAYIAAARVTGVEPDSDRAGHYYANVTDYLEFPTPVPFIRDGRYAEALLREVLNPSLVGRAVQGKSMRPILTEDFNDIVLAGLSETLDPANARKLDLDMLPFQLSLPTQPGFAQTVDRQVEQILLNRKIRDATFRLEVCRAYEDKCAVTGLRIINGGGRAEVQAAHIKPVAAGGPDVVQNGIALSATVHWLFDRHLISIDENHRLLVAHNRVPSELRNLFRPEHQGLHLPSDRKLWPHPAFLAHHREAFAGAMH